MRNRVTNSLLALLFLTTAAARADTLIFVAQSDVNGHINYSWFSTGNWFFPEIGTNGLTPANKLPVPGDTAQLRSAVNAAGNSISIAVLMTGGNNVSGGNFIVNESLQTGDGTAFTGSTIDIQSKWLATGYCALTGCTVTVESGAFLQLFVITSLLPKGLFLSDSKFHNVGQVIIADQSSLAFTGGTNRLDNLPNAVITGTGTTLVTTYNNAGAWLFFDNNGRVECQSGKLEFDCWNVIWTNSLGVGKLSTTATNASIEVSGPVTFPQGATNEVIGPGLTRLVSGNLATVLGVLQVGAVDLATGGLIVGNLEVDRDTTGSGEIHVLGLSGVGSTLNFGAGNITISLVNIDPSAQLLLTGPGSVAFLGAVINNGGNTVWTGEGNGFGMFNNATFNNLPGALFDARNNASIYGGGGTNDGVFNNAGIFRKSAGTNDTFFWYNSSPGVTFNNTGLLDVQIGRVVLMGGTGSGTFNVTNGARLRFWHSPYSLVDGVVFTGDGSVAVGGNAAVLLINGAITIPNFQVGDAEDSILDGPGTLTLTGTSSWSGGAIQGSGSLNIAPNAAFFITSGVPLHQRTINNSGTVTLTNTYGSITAGKGARFNNQPGGLLLFQVGNRGFDNDGTGSMPVLFNGGTISNDIAYFPSVNWILTNNSLLVVSSAGITFQQGFTQTAGNTFVSPGAALSLGGTTPCLLLGGTLTGSGQINGPVVNSATIAVSLAPLPPGAGGRLSFNTGYPKPFTQTSLGTLAVRIGGTQTGQFDQYAVINNTSALLGGTLAVSLNGFVPKPGDSFPILTFGSGSGTFAGITGNRASNGLLLLPAYMPGGVTLVAVNELELSSALLENGRPDLSFLTTTGLVYGIEAANSLTPPILWQTLTNFTGAGSLASFIDPSTNRPQRYYRISQTPPP